MNQLPLKSFNTAGPCNPTDHYMLPAIERIPTNIDGLISGKNYFVLHAPRQSGKTTTIKSLVNKINHENKYYALYCSVESLEKIPNSFDSAPLITEKLIQFMLKSGIKKLINACRGVSIFNPNNPSGLADNGKVPDEDYITVSNSITSPLQSVCQKLDKPLLIFIDEIDTLSGDVLVSCLRQLREGYIQRSEIPFPSSIALIGMRNIRDYKARIRPDSESLGTSSPFNIIKKAFTLANFTREEVKTLYGQHTEETGQAFEDGAVEQAMFWTDGQPWLVNALADDVIERQMVSVFTRPITSDHIDLAADRLKVDMNVHIDSLMARLQEPRVKRVMVPILTGAGPDGQASSLEDNQYCLDIGLIKKQPDGSHAPANRIYGDVIVRLLTWEFQNSLPMELEGRHVGPKGPEISDLLKDF
ncbi:MAG: ATP-binding protein, partial [Deltaproteobacteria bacterium]|nr:ATP-binding protein [Deltaproteobacteria bacterium]